MDTPTYYVAVNGCQKETKSVTEAAKWIAGAELAGMHVTFDVTALTGPVKEQRIQRLRTRIEEEKDWLSRTKEMDEIAAKDESIYARIDAETSELERRDEDLWRRLKKESKT